MPSRTRSTWRCAECALRSVGAFWASSFWEGSSESVGNGSARATGAPAKLCGSVSTRSDVRISAHRRASSSSAASSASGGAGFRAGRCFFALVGLAAGFCVCIGVCVSTVTMVRVAAIDSVASSSIGGSGARAGSVASSTVGGGGSGARASSSTLSVAGEGSDDTKGCSGSTGWCRAGRGGDAGAGSGLAAGDGRRRVRHRGHERRELGRTRWRRRRRRRATRGSGGVAKAFDGVVVGEPGFGVAATKAASFEDDRAGGGRGSVGDAGTASRKAASLDWGDGLGGAGGGGGARAGAGSGAAARVPIQWSSGRIGEAGAAAARAGTGAGGAGAGAGTGAGGAAGTGFGRCGGRRRCNYRYRRGGGRRGGRRLRRSGRRRRCGRGGAGGGGRGAGSGAAAAAANRSTASRNDWNSRSSSAPRWCRSASAHACSNSCWWQASAYVLPSTNSRTAAPEMSPPSPKRRKASRAAARTMRC